MTLSRAEMAFVAGLFVLAALFFAEIQAALGIWYSSTAYHHCWLVLPIALWLAWVRRERLTGQVARPAPIAILPALAAGAAWLLAAWLGLMEGRQLAALGLVYAWFLGVFGIRLTRDFAVPLAYLVFLVPFGAFLVPLLQHLTAWMIVVGLSLLEIPHFADALIIEIPAGVFWVAEACAGLRFLIASVAFGALYAAVVFRSPGRRVTVLVLSLIIPVLANGLRALGIVLLGHHLGSAEAAAADHLIYGWIFFSVVILLLIVAGLPFREDGPVPVEAATVEVPQAKLVPANALRTKRIWHAAGGQQRPLAGTPASATREGAIPPIGS